MTTRILILTYKVTIALALEFKKKRKKNLNIYSKCFNLHYSPCHLTEVRRRRGRTICFKILSNLFDFILVLYFIDKINDL